MQAESSAQAAAGFAWRYADAFERLVRQRMIDVGVPDHLIGNPDIPNGLARRTFFPQEAMGGGVVPGHGINVDSGVLDPCLLGNAMSGGAALAWSNARLRDRIDAVIAHEYEEAIGGTHAIALANAPNTRLRISDEARKLLRQMASDRP